MDIIIAEDNQTSLQLMNKMLLKDGENVHCAQNGIEALELLKKTDCRIVISDWIMPEMDGLELCSLIREKYSSPYIYIILLTSKSDVEDSLSAFEAGADDYIIKPFNPKELLARVRVGKRTIELEDKYEKASFQLLQSEKMAAIGQLAAGVAHEINNPIGFVKSNLRSLENYFKDITPALFRFNEMFKLNIENKIPEKEVLNKMLEDIEAMDLDFIIDDIPDLLNDCIDGTDRIGKIVTDMKNFAHPGSNDPKLSNINQGIDSTLNVIWNDIKYKAVVEKNYGEIPEIVCLPQKLNQVFMNLFINAAHAIEEKGKITITTNLDNDHIKIHIKDTGKGIPKENLPKIFDPFFTTKPVGKGTGLGLNVTYNIIKMHHGKIDVQSEVGKGTEFIITLPLNHDFKRDEFKNGY